jgi:hypothetical protein
LVDLDKPPEGIEGLDKLFEGLDGLLPGLGK